MDILRVRLVGRQQLVTSGLGHEVCASFGPWFRQGKERCQRPPPTLHLQFTKISLRAGSPRIFRTLWESSENYLSCSGGNASQNSGEGPPSESNHLEGHCQASRRVLARGRNYLLTTMLRKLVMMLGTGCALEVTRSYENVRSLAGEGLAYELRWSIEGESVYVAMTAETTGWIGLGFADPGGGGMPGSDMLLASVSDGVATVRDAWASGYSAPLDDACQDWVLVSGSENATHTVIEASRLLETGDSQDRTIRGKEFPRRLLAAYGESDDVSYHGSTRLAFRLPDPDALTIEEVASDPSVSRHDFLAGNYTVPEADTTYYRTCFDIPDDLGELHLVAFAPLIRDATSRYVHHFIVFGYRSSGCGGDPEDDDDDDDPGDVSSCPSVSQFFCEGGELKYGDECEACGNPSTCENKIDGASALSSWSEAETSCDDAAGNVSYSVECSADDEVVLTDCATGETYAAAEVGETFLCTCDDEDDEGGEGHIMYVWAPGGTPFALPIEAGFPVNGASGYKSLQLEIHYDNPTFDVGAVDDSGVSLYYTPNLRAHDAGVMTLGDLSGELYGSQVAGDSKMSHHRFACPSSCTADYFGDDVVTIFDTILHMHGTGARQVLSHYGRDATLARTLATEYYDFDFQDAVDARAMFGDRTFEFRGGDQFLVDCYYDERGWPRTRASSEKPARTRCAMSSSTSGPLRPTPTSPRSTARPRTAKSTAAPIFSRTTATSSAILASRATLARPAATTPVTPAAPRTYPPS